MNSTAVITTMMIARRMHARLSRAVLLAAALVLWGTGQAIALPVWEPQSTSNTMAAPDGTHDYLLVVRNMGDQATDLSTITVTAMLPPGITGVSASDSLGGAFSCPSVAGESVIVCTGTPFIGPAGANIVLTLRTSIGLGATGVRTATFSVEGGGAAVAGHTADPVTITTVPAVFGIDAFDGLASDAAGEPETRAGAHPFVLSTTIDFNTHTDPSPVVGDAWPVEDAKDVVVDLPPGLVGDPTSLSECTIPELANGDRIEPRPLCAATSQVGVTNVRIGGAIVGPIPVFNMKPPPGVPARFGFNVLGSVVVLNAEVRSGGDYGLTVRSTNIPQALAIAGTDFEFWGVPSDRSHDAVRACPGESNPYLGGPTCQSGGERVAFFRNPTSCTAPGVGHLTTVRADSWQDPGDYVQASFVSHLLPGYPFAPQSDDVPSLGWGAPHGTDSCEGVPFDPVLTGQPIAGATAGSPASFTFDLTIPQNDDPDLIAQSDLRKAVVTLPQGVRVSPSSATGLGACSSAQIALDSSAEPTCPTSSQLADVTIDTPLLREPVVGHMFLATPFDNPFDSLLAVYIVASARGVVVKLPGHVTTDPSTGQITTVFDDNPQLPFSRLHVQFRGGARAPLSLPNRCGTYTTRAEMTGWNGRTAISDSSFTLSQNARGRPCPPQFSPGFSAGTESNSAGSHSSFLLRFTRADEDQEFRDLTVRMPRGLTGKIANADLCTDDQVSRDACPANSKIGDVTTGAGAGVSPFFITNGRAYLTGPYKGAPFGVAIVVPAVAGPFDLGKVTVRSALFVDKKSAEVSIVSDPFPTILEGIPLDVRDVRVNVNKRDFFLNPTSCAEKTIRGTLTSTAGARADVSDRFQAADCGSLRLRPRMAIRVGGRGHTRRGRTTPFRTTLRMPRRNQTNLRFVRVTLPKTINARLTVINDACTRAEFESDIDKCAHAKAGRAMASTPLLRRPLRGNVYFVKNGHPIPDLFVALRGQVDFDLVGRISIPGGKRLRTTFATAPDVPIRRFSLRLLGGARNGSVGAAANLCSRASRRQKVEIDYIGQNGRVRQVDKRLKVGGCGKHGRRHRRR